MYVYNSDANNEHGLYSLHHFVFLELRKVTMKPVKSKTKETIQTIRLCKTNG